MLDGQVVSDAGGRGMSADGRTVAPRDALRVASVGLRARPLRAALSALGIAIGTAAIVAVLGLSSSSQAGLLAEIDRLGTNMLTVEAGQSLTGQDAQLPREAPGRITLLDHVEQVAHTALIKGENVYRSRLIPVTNTGGLQVRATSLNLLSVLNTGLARGALAQLGDRPRAGRCARLRSPRSGWASTGSSPTSGSGWESQWFNVAGVLESSPLEPDIDNSALIGYPAAQRYLGYVSLVRRRAAGRPAELDLRARGHRPRRRGAGAARADRQPRGARRGQRQPALRRAHRTRRRGRSVRQPLPRPRRRGADRRAPSASPTS